MSQLYDMKLKIEAKIKADGLNATEVKGKIGLQSGKLLAFINADTPDDATAVAKLRKAAQDVLRINL